MSADIDKKMQGSVSKPIHSFFSATMALTGFEISVGGVLSSRRCRTDLHRLQELG